MNEAQRQQEIVAWVNAEGTVSINSIIEQFQISPATARRDVTKLAESGKVKKVRNGVMRIHEQKSMWTPFNINKTNNYQEKSRIVTRAAGLCKDGDSVVINCGSTAFLLGRELCGRDVQIVTNYFPLASYLIEHEHDCVIIMGGQYNKTQNIILNPLPGTSENYAGHWMFTSGKGLTADGLYKTEILTAVSEQQMLGKVGKLVVLVDSSKVGQRAGMLFCPASNIEMVITGKDADPTVIDSLKQQGIEVILV